ncbi:calaxin-like [Episyrphus balteatus]|uniref:calaxin-like n=1 Tax=Episyrphus balteatus TaxID=286459 RepID=UPI002485EC2B|nr:calaxin-like [Episyrphus balteatus]
MKINFIFKNKSKKNKMNNLDGTLDGIQNTRFLNIYHGLIKQMLKQTQFSEMELNCILMIYHKFVLLNGPRAKAMTKKQFFHLFEVLFKVFDLQIIERIMILIAKESKNHIPPIAWVKLFSVFMSDSLDEKMKFVFSIYNLHETNFLNREILTKFVDKFFTGEDEDEVVELTADMVDLLFKKFDLDRDGLISYDDYSTVVRKTPMLLEFLGPCLPSRDGLTVTAYCSNILSKMGDMGLNQDDVK